MPGKHVRHGEIYTALHLLMIVLVIVVLVWPFMEPRTMKIEQTTIQSTSLPTTIGQMRVVYLSDIHEGQFPFFSHDQVVSMVSKINSLNADLVLLGGDYAEDANGAIDFFLNLPAIRANYGVYAVLGENDRTTMDSATNSRLRAAMIAAGVTPLINKVESVRIGRTDIYLAGIDDVRAGNPKLAEVAASVKQDQYVIFMCHNPSVLTDALAAKEADGKINWFDLGLFGHTHGGQIPVLGPMLGIATDTEQGWFTENRIPMLISRGIGTEGLPIRALCQPTIHVITIRSEK